MDESTAWLEQARADWQAAERMYAEATTLGACHAVAKWQQTVEKAVKALIVALREVGVIHISLRMRHEVEPYFDSLVRLPRVSRNRTIQSHLHSLLDQTTRGNINVLESLAPSAAATRNTEYPFLEGINNWTYPAAIDTFSNEEIGRHRQLAHRVLVGSERLLTVLDRLSN